MLGCCDLVFHHPRFHLLTLTWLSSSRKAPSLIVLEAPVRAAWVNIVCQYGFVLLFLICYLFFFLLKHVYLHGWSGCGMVLWLGSFMPTASDVKGFADLLIYLHASVLSNPRTSVSWLASALQWKKQFPCWSCMLPRLYLPSRVYLLSSLFLPSSPYLLSSLFLPPRWSLLTKNLPG